jgi:putative intracellular protease/amidase
MAGELTGRTIAVLATDGVEQVELTEPVSALKGAGAEVKVISDKKPEIQASSTTTKPPRFLSTHLWMKPNPRISTA